ncbi:MAG: sporulation protein [Myxococcales bacterium]|nr:sporulation protein [Myxococcales bacterium]
MGFSEKMRESLGAEGARVRVVAPEGTVPRGQTTTASVTITGGTREATIDALIVRVVEADRYWVRSFDGARVEEADAQALTNRSGLTAGWDRQPVLEQRLELSQVIPPGSEHSLTIDVPVPTDCKATSVCCSHTLNVQADIKGQIDPAGNARINLA